MVPASLEIPVSGHRFSSVVPAKVTGGNKDFELTNMDLAMKLHYIKGVYFFQSEAAQGLSVHDLKVPMFECLEHYYTVSGRIRRSETGRPFIKCNDGGVRIIEARCNQTVDEWLATARDKDHSLDHMLAYDQVLGPDLGFSPLAFVQFTWFECGGISVGLSWAHVLGDAFSASEFLNAWAQIMAEEQLSSKVNDRVLKSEFPAFVSGKPFSLKKVDPVGDRWITANDSRTVTHSFHITGKQLHHYMTDKISDFEIISAIIWQSMSKVRIDLGPKTVTICSNNRLVRGDELAAQPVNGMTLSTVKADFCVSKVEIAELAKLIADRKVPENGLIEDLLSGDEEKSDFIVYGANLTFVNLEGADLYGLQLKGLKPVFVNYMINGVGDEGTCLIVPSNEKDGGNGKIVTMTLPEDQIEKLKSILENDWNISN
ncbi:protein ECERIFERUM 26-like isoform X2 [Hibiscus syriacus]|uniref:protein ECERIFERUM 26-like isoform X2 n=1 Tax=Hibiscus syriacus TaxID=106335 RepID=UPI00192107CB|nr:protein ECERIFERUM 26-like isoform X2 [Hibiscus syriacus]